MDPSAQNLPKNPVADRGSSALVSGFTLIEVLLAVGVFTLTIIGMLALLTPVTRQVRDIFDSNLASRAIGSIEKELLRIERTPGANDGRTGFFYFVGDNLDSSLLKNEVVLYASEDGSLARIDAVVNNAPTDTPRGIPVDQRYFEIFAQAFDTGDFVYQSGNAYIPLQVTITWPFTLPDGSVVAVEERQSFTYTTALVAGQ